MNRCLVAALMAALLSLLSPAALAQESGASLSEKQLAVIAKRTANMSEEEKAIVAGWTDGKKAAEFFCRDLALATLKKQFMGADRVFLEVTNADRRPTLMSPSLVVGVGTVRHDGGWADFSYECELDPERGTTTGFRFTPKGPERDP